MFSFIKNVSSKVSNAINSKTVALGVACSSVLVASAAFAAEGDVTLHATGIDVGKYVTAAATSLGTVLSVIIGSYFAFLVIRKALRWARTSM